MDKQPMSREDGSENSDNKTDRYGRYVIYFNHAAKMARANTFGWALKSCCTDPDYASTVYSNGKTEISAVTIDGVHTYTMKKANEDEQS